MVYTSGGGGTFSGGSLYYFRDFDIQIMSSGRFVCLFNCLSVFNLELQEKTEISHFSYKLIKLGKS